MAIDGMRGYVQAVAGLTEVTRQRARELAQALQASSQAAVPPGAGGMANQVSALAEDILATARSNRGLLMDLVRSEVNRSVQGLGLASPAEVDRLRRRVATLERRLEQVESATASSSSTTAPARGAPARQTLAPRASVPRAGVRKPAAAKEPTPAAMPPKATPPAAAEKALATKKTPTTKKTPAKKAPATKKAPAAKKAPAKKAPATKKTPAKKSPARKSPAKRATE